MAFLSDVAGAKKNCTNCYSRNSVDDRECPLCVIGSPSGLYHPDGRFWAQSGNYPAITSRVPLIQMDPTYFFFARGFMLLMVVLIQILFFVEIIQGPRFRYLARSSPALPESGFG